LSEWRTGCALLGKLLGEAALCAGKRLNQAENRFAQRGDRTQEVAGSSPARSMKPPQNGGFLVFFRALSEW
jgi:hypothetical protein